MKFSKKMIIVPILVMALFLGGALTVSASEDVCVNGGPHNLKSYMPDGWEHGTNHSTVCTNEGCDYYIHHDPCNLVPMSMETIYYMNDPEKYPYMSEGHWVDVKCSVCGNEPGVNRGYSAAHKFDKVTNKCACGFQRILPGNTKIKSAKQDGRMQVRKGTVAGYWYKTYIGSSGYVWEYQPSYTYNNKCYKIKFNLKKAKNADHYLVSTKKNPNASAGNAKQQFSKNKFTYTYVKGKAVNKVTLYVTPVSKTGDYGKTIKKTIRLR